MRRVLLLLLVVLLLMTGCTTSAVKTSPTPTSTMVRGSELSVYAGTGLCVQGLADDPGCKLVALDAGTGAIRWSYGGAAAAGLAFFSSPVVADGVAYGCVMGGDVVALSTATGAVRWRYHVPLANPANIADLVLGDGVLLVDWNADHLRALDAATGAPLWDFAAAYIQVTSLHSVPLIVGGIVYLTNYSGNQNVLLAMGLHDGHLRWQHDEAARGGLNGVRLATDGTQLYAVVGPGGPAQALTSPFQVAAFSLADGHVLWVSPTFVANRVNTLRAADGLVVATDIFTGAYVFDASTGKPLLRYPEPPPTPSNLIVMSGAALAEGMVYLGLGDGTYLALNGHTGAVRWHTEQYGTSDGNKYYPVVRDGLLFAPVGAFNRRGPVALIAVDTRTGSLVWRHPFGNGNGIHWQWSVSPAS